MNLDELRPILAAYRKQVEPAWSAATAHPDYEGKPGDPTGQCGVTSAWLQRRLREDHGIETAIRFLAWSHCWLETVEPGDAYPVVIDLTANQWPQTEKWVVVCDEFTDLVRQDLLYVYIQSLTHEQLLADPVQERLALLTEAVQS